MWGRLSLRDLLSTDISVYLGSYSCDHYSYNHDDENKRDIALSCFSKKILIKLPYANCMLSRRSAEPVKATPITLPPEIIAQIVTYVLEAEDDWIVLYRTTPRWRQPKFEAEIEGYILRQRRLESVRLASVSNTFLAEVVFTLRKGISEQQKVIGSLRDMDRMDDRIVQFLVSECEMLDDVSHRLQNIGLEGGADSRFISHWKCKLTSFGRWVRGA